MKTLRSLVGIALAAALVGPGGCGEAEAPSDEPEEESQTYAGKLLGGLDRTAINRTRGDMEAIARALGMYATGQGSYPEAADFEAVKAAIWPTYLRSVPDHDQWANPLKVESTAEGFKITALGADGLEGTDDDIVMEPGGFTHLPKGVR